MVRIAKTLLTRTTCLCVAVHLFAIYAARVEAQEVRSINFAPLTSLAAPRKFQLFLPDLPSASAKASVVVMVHGTVGIRRNNQWYRVGLLRAGIGVAEVDFKSGIFVGGDRPNHGFFQPYAYGVLKALRRTPNVDPDKIAIMGFSMGGWVTLHAAEEGWKRRMIGDDQPFAAHIAIYAGCARLSVKRMTGKPVLMIHGTADQYTDETQCKNFARAVNDRHPGLVRYKPHDGANHRFDWWPLPGKSNPWWNESAARASRREVVTFLGQVFEIPNSASQMDHPGGTVNMPPFQKMDEYVKFTSEVKTLLTMILRDAGGFDKYCFNRRDGRTAVIGTSIQKMIAGGEKIPRGASRRVGQFLRVECRLR